MSENKINVEIKRVNKKTREVEWTDTLEIPYEAIDEQISKEEKEKIKEQYCKKDNDNNLNNQYDKENFLLNTTVLNMKYNPFHQPSMNTLEFEDNDAFVIASITKDNQTNINENDELIALKKLLEMNIISQDEYEEKRQIIMNKYQKNNN